MSNEQLINLLELLKTDVINSMQSTGRYTTGETAMQMTITEDNGRAQLSFPGYIQLLETGRGITKQGAAAGNPSMIDRIKYWCQAKGIPDKAAWAIKKSIDKKGYKGFPGVLSLPLGEDNINSRLNPTLNDTAQKLCNELCSHQFLT